MPQLCSTRFIQERYPLIPFFGKAAYLPLTEGAAAISF